MTPQLGEVPHTCSGAQSQAGLGYSMRPYLKKVNLKKKEFLILGCSVYRSHFEAKDGLEFQVGLKS